ncbi:MAG: DKNYY domain-containing protein [Anaerolineales bacterium]|nr:DKNYY domain-containing protein [Anaerolineales bacterium]
MMHKRVSLLILLLFIGLASACAFRTGYQKRGVSYVYITLDEGQGYVEHPIMNMDAPSFEILNRGYAKDVLHVYYHEMTVEGADPGSFVALSELHGKDQAQVYYAGQAIPGADPASFTLIDLQWGKDAQDVYFQNRPLEACDPATFVFLAEDWQRDDQCAYRQGKKLPDADGASFVVLNYWFGKDNHHAYSHLGTIIDGADVTTFKLRQGICVVCAEDKNRCYRYEEPVACESLK